MGYKQDRLDITSLVINIENPRFEMVGNQREAISIMLENQKDKLYKLGQDIINSGLNPADLIIVTPHEKNAGQFNVLEGNRRLTALKLLSTPSLIPEKYKSLLTKFKKLHEAFKLSPITQVLCVVVDDEEEAYRWIKLKHTGENDGVGTVTWDAQQKARFDERGDGKSSYALQILEFLKKNDDIDSGVKDVLSKVPSSSLQRLITDPDIRKLVGLEIQEGKITTDLPTSEITKPLTKIVKDLVRDDFKVKEIYYKDDRLNYIETFKADELPNKEDSIVEWELVTPNPPKPSTIPAKKKKKSKALSTARKTIIPKECIIHITPTRINHIYRELKDLNVEDFTNAGAITLRVFVELTLDVFIEEKSLSGVTKDSKLSAKTSSVATYLKDNNHLDRHGLKPIQTAVSSPNSILSINTFNAYVHNKHFNPIPNDLKITWDNIELFIVKIWELI